MNVEQLLESELAKATKEVQRLVKEQEMAVYTLNNIREKLIEVDSRRLELEAALDMWVEQ